MTTRAVARWIESVSWAFVALGIVLPLAFHSGAFGSYRDAVARWAYGQPGIAAADEKLLGLMLGILGGSIAGKWIVHAMLARGPLAEGRAWARNLTVAGLAAWFLVDSFASLMLGASFNVWMINLAPVVLVGLPIFAWYGLFRDEGAAPLMTPAARACFWTAILGAGTGIAIAFGGSTPLFGMWFRDLELIHYDSVPLADPARRLALFFFGPIGGCTLAQFVMLAGIARRERAAGRAATTGMLSIAAWFAVDSGYCLAHDGLFNILLVNVPALILTLPPWIAMKIRSGNTGDR